MAESAPGASSSPARARTAPAAALLANGLVFLVVAVAASVWRWAPEVYQRVVQEDELLEWASFWAFVWAACVFAAVALRRPRRSMADLWFPLGLAVFCGWVALEEISWGQRVFGYRPPAYFLEHNYQQELNLHNVVDSDLRQLGLKAVILGYGVGLPLLGAVPAVAVLLRRLGVMSPPRALVPAFLATWALYELYPLDFSGEWVELMLGLGFLFSAVLGSTGWVGASRGALGVLVAGALVCASGLASAAWSRGQREAHPGSVEAARSEVSALATDFRGARLRTSCGLHQRLFTFVRRNEVEVFDGGRFAALVGQGLPDERARFFLDPWNSPWWVRDTCGEEDRRRRRIFVYSFGPNRMRDSTEWEIRGDDVGEIVFDAGRD